MGFRRPTAAEQALLDKLLAPTFPGSNELRAQLEGLDVRIIDEDGGLELRPGPGPYAEVLDRIPVEGELLDRDGVKAHVLLHVIDGRLHELEVYKEDGSRMFQLKAERMTVECFGAGQD